jgi:hypothetical protein
MARFSFIWSMSQVERFPEENTGTICKEDPTPPKNNSITYAELLRRGRSRGSSSDRKG